MTDTKHVVDDPDSKCDCRECWYMRGFVEACDRAMKLVGGEAAEQIRALKPQYKLTVKLVGFEAEKEKT